MALTLVCARVALADPISGDFFAVDVPSGWHVDRDEKGAVTVTPRRDEYATGLSIVSYEWTKIPDLVACKGDEIRKNFFWFFASQPPAVYSEGSGVGGYREFRAVGVLGDVTFQKADARSDAGPWVASSIVCGPKGILHVSSSSDESQRNAVNRLNTLMDTLRWTTPRGQEPK